MRSLRELNEFNSYKLLRTVPDTYVLVKQYLLLLLLLLFININVIIEIFSKVGSKEHKYPEMY